MVMRLSRIAPALLAVACATARAEPSAQDPLSRGLVALDTERWSAAESALHQAAASCESGRSGMDAVLLLATTALDPSNPGRDVDAAARYAAHVIRLPLVDAVRLEIAEGLYLAAIDAGADPVAAEGRRARATTPPGGLAARFSSCDADAVTPRVVRTPPRYPGTPMAATLAATRARADSLAAVVDSVSAVTDRIASMREEEATLEEGTEVTRLRSRIQALETELARIRKLLRKGG